MSDANEFWVWAQEVWHAPGIEGACLQLQDGDRLSVAAILFASWCARQGLQMDPDCLVTAGVFDWEQRVLRPMRESRRAIAAIKGRSSPACVAARELELRLERELYDWLFTLARERMAAAEGPASEVLAANLAVALACRPPDQQPPPLADVQRLLDALWPELPADERARLAGACVETPAG